MQEKRLKGVIRFVIIAIFSLVIGLLLAGFHYINSGAECLYNQGTIYDPKTSTGNQAIKVVGIYPEPIIEVSDQKLVYLIRDEKGNLVGLEADKGDKQVADMIDKGEQLAKEPKLLDVVAFQMKYENSRQIQNYESTFRSLFSETDLLSNQVVSDSYVSLAEVSYNNWMGYGIGAGLSVISLVFIVLAVWRFRKNKQFYQAIYKIYPELDGQFELLQKEASFLDEQLKILIYKEHLIGYYKGFDLFDLQQIKQLYHVRAVTRHTHNSFLTLVDKESGKNTNLEIKDIGGEKTRGQLDYLYDYLAAHFPEIRLSDGDVAEDRDIFKEKK